MVHPFPILHTSKASRSFGLGNRYWPVSRDWHKLLDSWYLTFFGSTEYRFALAEGLKVLLAERGYKVSRMGSELEVLWR